jgi:hypothetical protein
MMAIMAWVRPGYDLHKFIIEEDYFECGVKVGIFNHYQIMRELQRYRHLAVVHVRRTNNARQLHFLYQQLCLPRAESSSNNYRRIMLQSSPES